MYDSYNVFQIEKVIGLEFSEIWKESTHVKPALMYEGTFLNRLH